MNFKEWLLSEGSNPGSKTGLYPTGYGGIGLYPPQWYLTRSADAIFYLSLDDRIYNFKNHKLQNKYLNSGDKGLWDISKLEGPKDTPKTPDKHGMATNNGEGGMWNIKHIEGSPSYKKNKEFVPDQGESGIWDITKLKGKPSYKKNKEFVPNQGEGGTWNIKEV